MHLPITEFSPNVVSLAEWGIGEFPLEHQIPRLMGAEPPDGWRETGLTRHHYLDLMERIVSQAVGWQDASGAIIDPVLGREWAHTTSRFASSGAVLLHFGRMPQLREPVGRAMDWVCSRLPKGLMQAADFQMREIMTALTYLENIAEPAQVRRWSEDIAAVEPERIYTHVRPDGRNMETLANINVYAAAGEYLRARHGLAPAGPVVWGLDFCEKYLPSHLRARFTEYGMYRDPGDPITYDITTRLQLATMLAFGYEGPCRPAIAELLRRGGLTTLLFVTPDGIVPYGGRSDQFHFREIIISALCELEARRYAASDRRLAGAFKRQARLSALAVDRWLLDMRPLRHLKQGFEPSRGWGIDPYGHYSVYSLLASSFLGLAALFADDRIEERPCPAETGGFVLELPGAFNKVFANCGGTWLEIDARADLAHNATGLGSVQMAGVPTELALAMPFSANPSYRLEPEYVPWAPLAIGPAWRVRGQWRYLADQSAGLDSQLEVLEQGTHRAEFRLTYRTAAGDSVQEHYLLEAGRLQIRSNATGDGPIGAMRFHVPLIVTDGLAASQIGAEAGLVRILYRGARYTVRFDPPLDMRIDERQIGNRNGLYKVLVLQTPGDSIGATLELARPE
jgi:hypothetical protein